MIDYMTDIYRLAYIKRYSNIPKIHSESVAEHGFFVAAICMGLYDEYKFDLGIALEIAISHDIPEMELNDCPVIIKEKYPEIKEAFNICEKRVAEHLPSAVREGVTLFDTSNTIEVKIVHLADAMQVKQFAEVEVDLGNKGYMQRVFVYAENKINKLRDELVDYAYTNNR